MWRLAFILLHESKLRMNNVISRIRILATFVVVAFHCACPLFLWGVESHAAHFETGKILFDFIFFRLLPDKLMPSFFLISGLLFYSNKEKYQNRIEAFWKKFNRIIIPMSLIYCLTSCFDIPNIGGGIVAGHLWFLKVLFTFFCLALLFYKVKEWILLVFGIVAYAISLSQRRLGFDIGWYPLFCMHYFLFFIGGHFLSRYYSLLRTRRVQIPLILISLVSVLMNCMSIYSVSFNILLFAFMPEKTLRNPFWTFIDRNSYAIYLLHHILLFSLFLLTPVCWLYSYSVSIAILTTLFVVVASTLFVCWTLRKVNFPFF